MALRLWNSLLNEIPFALSQVMLRWHTKAAELLGPAPPPFTFCCCFSVLLNRFGALTVRTGILNYPQKQIGSQYSPLIQRCVPCHLYQQQFCQCILNQLLFPKGFQPHIEGIRISQPKRELSKDSFDWALVIKESHILFLEGAGCYKWHLSIHLQRLAVPSSKMSSVSRMSKDEEGQAQM